jgi:type IV pilus assembly protein PilF
MRSCRWIGARAVLGAIGLVLAMGCTSVEKTEPVRELRGSAEVRRDAAGPPGRSVGAGTPPGVVAAGQGESDASRRARIRLELATGFYQKRNYGQAIEELRAALTADPNLAEAHGMLGLVYMELDDRVRAQEGFQRALALAPDNPELLNNYGWFLCQTDRARESIPQFLAALKDPLYATPARPLHNAGICAMRAGDPVAAESYFERSFQLDPRNPVAMYHLAEIYLKRGDLERARFHSQRLLSSYPASPETLWLGIRVDRKSGNRDGVASLSAQLRRQFPSSAEANLLQRGAFGD